MLTVLIPTDFSENSANAIRYAAQLSKKMKFRFVFFHGELLPLPLTVEVPVMSLAVDKTIFFRKMKSQVERIFKSLKIKMPSADLEMHVSEGFSIPAQILDTAESFETDMIIMGNRGSSEVKKRLIGSNTVDVISHSHIPVLTVPEKYKYSGISKMLHASDLKNIGAEINLVLPWAKIFKATLEVININDATVESNKLIQQTKQIIKRKSYAKLKLHVEGKTYGETFDKEMNDIIRRHKPDLAIMFRHEHNWLGRLLLNSKTEQMAFDTTVPLLAFRG